MSGILLTNEQIRTFCVALEHLIHAGIGLGDALTLLKEDEQEPELRQMFSQMAKNADEGAALSAVIRGSGRFPAYVSTLAEVGERSGKIEQTLQTLARYYENRERLDRHVRAALVYPAALLAVLLAVAVVLLIWVLPVFNDVYARLGSSLTGVAGVLLDLGVVLRKGMPVICGIIGVVAALFAVKPLRDRIFLLWNRSFGDRGAGNLVLSARFVQALSMAISSGMQTQDALKLCCALAQEEAPAFRRRCENCFADVDTGKTLSRALCENGFLSAADRRLLDAGERSGSGENALRQIAERMVEQGEEAMERKAARVEPVIVAIACVLIGTVLLSVMLPLMHIMSAIG